MQSIYWVISRDCNQRCAHCYNDSEPGAPGLTLEDATRCVAHLPDPDDVPVDWIILSGGEPLVWPELLFHALAELYAKYGERTRLWVQTNGDLLDEATLQRLLDHHVARVDVASQDRFHHRESLRRAGMLEAMFRAHGMVPFGEVEGAGLAPGAPTAYAFWGANPEEWIGPLWPRGRARRRNLTKSTPDDRFCALWSGAKGFLDYRAPGSEVNIQLADVYPCCIMTAAPIGNLLKHSLTDILDRCAAHPVFRALNEGRPEAMGETLGISEAEGEARTQALGNHCLWCDEFFLKYARELLDWEGMTARGDVDLPQAGPGVRAAG